MKVFSLFFITSYAAGKMQWSLPPLTRLKVNVDCGSSVDPQ
jgi:hypothetical protein